MNKRIISIIQELCKLEKNINISGLAKQFQVSQRTIRNDLNAINEILKEHGLAELKVEKGGSISRNNKFVDILSFVSEKSFYEYKLSKEERKRVASALLVNSTGYITLSMIADNLFVSRATIISDLDEIKAFIKKGNLKVLSHPNKGLRVEGRESDKRLFLMRLFDSNNDIVEREMIEKYISVQAESKMIIQKIIYEQEHVHKSFLTDDSFQKVLLYLGIMINRNMQGEYVEVRREKNNSKHLMAQDILKYISQYCHINTTEDEVRFLSEILTKVRYMKQSTLDLC
jgi:mannitol operon transcriptional antiterminator